MKDVEKRFYATDIAVDDQVDRLVIAVTSSDEDTDTVTVVQLMTKGHTQRVGTRSVLKFHCYNVLSIAIKIKNKDIKDIKNNQKIHYKNTQKNQKKKKKKKNTKKIIKST